MKLTGQQAEDEVRFWMNQDTEHLQFLAENTVEPTLQKDAASLWSTYRTSLPTATPEQVTTLLAQSQALKRRALDASLQGWIGWLFPAVIEHMIIEMDAMTARVTTGLPDRDELCLIAQHSAEVAAVVAHLLDPTELDLQAAARKEAREAGDVADACQTQEYAALRQATLSGTGRLEQLSIDPRLARARSILNPAMVAHERRENMRFAMMLNAIPAQDPAAPAQPGFAGWR